MSSTLAQLAALVNLDGRAKYPETRRECDNCGGEGNIEVYRSPSEYGADAWDGAGNDIADYPECADCSGTGYTLAPAAEAAWALVRRLGMSLSYGLSPPQWCSVARWQWQATWADTPEEAVFRAALATERA